jgi:esterase
MAENPILAHTRVAAAGHEPERWLLVLHGIYGAGRNWGSIARRLVEARPEWGAVLVDLRNHGQSRGFAEPHTIASAAADVDRLVEHLDLHAAALLGHSCLL